MRDARYRAYRAWARASVGVVVDERAGRDEVPRDGLRGLLLQAPQVAAHLGVQLGGRHVVGKRRRRHPDLVGAPAVAALGPVARPALARATGLGTAAAAVAVVATGRPVAPEPLAGAVGRAAVVARTGRSAVGTLVARRTSRSGRRDHGAPPDGRHRAAHRRAGRGPGMCSEADGRRCGPTTDGRRDHRGAPGSGRPRGGPIRGPRRPAAGARPAGRGRTCHVPGWCSRHERGGDRGRRTRCGLRRPGNRGSRRCGRAGGSPSPRRGRSGIRETASRPRRTGDPCFPDLPRCRQPGSREVGHRSGSRSGIQNRNHHGCRRGTRDGPSPGRWRPARCRDIRGWRDGSHPGRHGFRCGRQGRRPVSASLLRYPPRYPLSSERELRPVVWPPR